MFENFKFHIFIKYFMILVSFLIIPFIAFWILVTNYIMSEYKKEIYNLAQNSVDYICSMVEDEMKEIYKIEALVMQNSKIQNFISNPPGERRGEKVYEAYEVSMIMGNYCTYSDIISEIHLYSEGRDTIVVPNGIYTSEEYYNNYLIYSDMTFEQWCDFIERNSQDISPLIYNNQNQTQNKGVAMLDVLYHSGRKNSALFFILDMNKILDIYENVTKELPEMYFAVILGENIVIMSDNMSEGINIKGLIDCESGEKMEGDYVVFRSISSDRSFSYVCVANEEEILDRFNKVEGILKSFIVFLTLSMVLVAFLFSNKTFGPVKEMLLLCTSDIKCKINGLTDIQDLFVNVFNANTKLRELVSVQEKCINNNMFKLLLQNSMDMDNDTLQVLFKAIPISLNAKYFRVAIMEFKKSHECEEESIRFEILSKFHEKCGKTSFEYCVIPNETDKDIFLFAYEERDIKIEMFLKELLYELKQSDKINARIALGREIENFYDFSKSYEVAVFALQKNKTDTICCDEKGETFADNMELLNKEKIVSYILAGNKERLDKFFEVLYMEMFDEYVQTYRIQNYVRYFLYDALKDALRSKIDHDQKLAKVVNKCASALELNTYEESFWIIKESFIDAAENIAEKSNKKKNFDDVINYIHKNYALYDLSLKKLADEMDISYKYLSDIFKKETGSTFLDYLHDLRNKKAKELLISTEIPISEIGEQIGYLSSNTFIKTFKKLNGITPGEYRKKFCGG